MIKIVAFLSFGFFYINTSKAQYYYKDLVSSQQAATDMAKYRENKIRTVSIKSFEDDGSVSDGFLGERKISKDYTKSELFVRSNVSGSSLLTSTFNEKGKITGSHDSSEIASTRTYYFYDDQERINKITTSLHSADDDFVNEILEEHIYIYEDEYLPVKMIKVKNRRDSTTILFLHDENSNISIEKDTKSGSKFYYYYDEKSRLNHIAHSNEYKPKLFTDYLFEYNTSGHLIEMITTEEGGSDYYRWRYTYSPEGLRLTEKCYSKERRLMGSIQYLFK